MVKLEVYEAHENPAQLLNYVLGWNGPIRFDHHGVYLEAVYLLSVTGATISILRPSENVKLHHFFEAFAALKAEEVGELGCALPEEFKS